MYVSEWLETLDGFLKLPKHEILAHAGKISAKAAELKAKREYKKYKASLLDGVSKVEKDYIKALKDMEMRLLGESDKNKYNYSNNGELGELRLYLILTNISRFN